MEASLNNKLGRSIIVVVNDCERTTTAAGAALTKNDLSPLLLAEGRHRLGLSKVSWANAED